MLLSYKAPARRRGSLIKKTAKYGKDADTLGKGDRDELRENEDHDGGDQKRRDDQDRLSSLFKGKGEQRDEQKGRQHKADPENDDYIRENTDYAETDLLPPAACLGAYLRRRFRNGFPSFLGKCSKSRDKPAQAQ